MTKFIGTIQLPSGGTGVFHRMSQVTLDHEHERVILDLASWPTREAGENGYAPEMQRLSIAFADLPNAGAFLASIKASITGTGAPLAGVVEDTLVLNLVDAKARKNAAINRWREKANEVFSYSSKTFSADTLSWKDISGTNGWVSRHSSLPPGWPGGWKAIDNTYISIVTIEEWDQFYAAAVATGAANFGRAQALKVLVQSAETAEDLDDITWDMVL